MESTIFRRKVQKIANSTYTISLPRDWVVDNNISTGDELTLQYFGNNQILVDTSTSNEINKQEIVINLDTSEESIENLIFSSYYMGVEEIKITSKKPIESNTRRKIRKTAGHLIGTTEIQTDSDKEAQFKILLDKSKVDIMQLIRRTTMILNISLEDLEEGDLHQEIAENEKEVDKLFHLIFRIINQGIRDSTILFSSNIKNTLFIPSLLSIGKSLEVIGDNIYEISKKINKENLEAERINMKPLLRSFKEEISKTNTAFQKKSSKGFVSIKKGDESMEEKIRRIENEKLRNIAWLVFTNIMEFENSVTHYLIFKEIYEQKNNNM